MNFLRLNRTEDRTNIFNLDQVTDVYVDDNKVAISLTGGIEEVNVYVFHKNRELKEYEALKHFFKDNLKANDINIMARS